MLDDSDHTISASLESPLGLLEELFGDNPLHLLLSTIILNRTQRVQVDGIFHLFLQRWPTAEAIIAAPLEEIQALIAPLGIGCRRASGIVRFARDYLDLLASKSDLVACTTGSNRLKSTLESPPAVAFHLTSDDIQSLFHCGTYAADAYQIFIRRDWTICPSDNALRAYVEWKRGWQSQTQPS